MKWSRWLYAAGAVAWGIGAARMMLTDYQPDEWLVTAMFVLLSVDLLLDATDPHR